MTRARGRAILAASCTRQTWGDTVMIARSVFLLGSTFLLAGAAGAHSLTVVGGNADAVACFRAADSEMARPDALARCDAAIAETSLNRRDLLATHVNRGIVRFRLERFEAAIEDFDAALALQPGQPDAMINKGIVMMAAGAELDGALRLIEAGLGAGPQRPWVGYYGRAVAHELAGRDAQAYRDYRRAAELRPNWRPASQALARFAVTG
jgi:tetratricopeptide (TPR) repeat protein